MSIKLEWPNPPKQHTGQQAERARAVLAALLGGEQS